MSFDLKLRDGQLVLKNSGDIDIVYNTEKLEQDVIKVAITPLGANKLNPWYGSILSKTLIGMPFDLELAKNLSADQLVSSLETLRILQINQAQQQNVSASEAISSILGVDFKRDELDFRKISVFINILSRSSKKSLIELTVSP